MKKIILATNNKHKLDEIKVILNLENIYSLEDFGVKLDVDENGKTFMENSYKKAFETYKYFVENNLYTSDMCFLSDDSGLCIDALDGRPGIHSARYGQTGNTRLDASIRNNLVLKELLGVKNRDAHFVCAVTLLSSKDDFVCVSSILNGSIHETQLGENGFAYDRIFFLKEYNTTLGNLDISVKNSISHRYKSFQKIKNLL